MSTFIATSCCQKLTTKCLNGTLYDKEDKDVLVSKLNSRISKLEQEDKDYDLLNQEFKELENIILKGYQISKEKMKIFKVL